jgi:hypothetical protein
MIEAILIIFLVARAAYPALFAIVLYWLVLRIQSPVINRFLFDKGGEWLFFIGVFLTPLLLDHWLWGQNLHKGLLAIMGLANTIALFVLTVIVGFFVPVAEDNAPSHKQEGIDAHASPASPASRQEGGARHSRPSGPGPKDGHRPQSNPRGQGTRSNISGAQGSAHTPSLSGSVHRQEGVLRDMPSLAQKGGRDYPAQVNLHQYLQDSHWQRRRYPWRKDIFVRPEMGDARPYSGSK